MTLRLYETSNPGPAAHSAKNDTAGPGLPSNPGRATERNPMVGAIAAADRTPDLIDPRVYHVAQETYRVRLAELGPDRHMSALNAAIDAVAARLLHTHFLVGGLPGSGKSVPVLALLVGGEVA